jgi:eukaryotic-like serine/threonine-protein kinase
MSKRRHFFSLVILALYLSPVLAERPGELVFRCQVPDAVVIVQVSSNQAYQLPCNQRIPLDLEPYLSGRVLGVEFKREGYFPTTFELKALGRKGGNTTFSEENRDPKGVFYFPAQQHDPVRLKASVWWIPILVFLRFHPVFVGVALTGLLLLGALVARQRSLHRKQRERAKILERYEAGRAGDDLIQARCGPYRLVERLGEGGMGVVYRAVPDESLDDRQSVAVKVITQATELREDELERFRHEYRILAGLQHPRILQVIDIDKIGDRDCIVMEFVEGKSLESLLNEGRREITQVLLLIRQIVDGLHYAHQRQVVHRDLKPANLMLTHKQGIKIMDFGLARRADLTRLTQSGTILGTPLYMAPEQVRGEEPTPSCDQYSLGILFYEMLTGSPPFVSNEPFAVIQKHLTEEPKDPREIRPEIPDSVAQAIVRMLRKQPEERFDSLAEVAEIIDVQLS